jgi:pyruvate dehydrogenase E1 component
MVEHLSDDQLRNLSRGGHDYRKVYAAFKAAREHVGQPTVILTHTIEGWTLGKDFEARNATHQMKKLTVAELKEFRDRLYLEIPDSALEADLPPYYHPGEDSDEISYMKERRLALGGSLPRRVVRAKPLAQPPAAVFDEYRRGSGKQLVATTMAFVRILKDLMKDPVIGERFVPIIPDEARTFGMDSLFPTAKIYSPFGQTYEAVDRNLMLSYKESESGQLLDEGILRGIYRYAPAEPGDAPRAQLLASGRFFHVDAESITLAALSELARSGQVDRSLPAQAITKYKLDLPVSEALG